MPRNRPRILIADDHTLVADLCKKLLDTEFDVVSTLGDGRALVRAATDLSPDVIQVGIFMPMLNGLDAARQVREMLPAVKVSESRPRNGSASAPPGHLRIPAEDLRCVRSN